MQQVLWSGGRLVLWLNKVSGAIVLLESFVCRGIMGFIVLEGAQILGESYSVHTGPVEVYSCSSFTETSSALYQDNVLCRIFYNFIERLGRCKVYTGLVEVYIGVI